MSTSHASLAPLQADQAGSIKAFELLRQLLGLSPEQLALLEWISPVEAVSYVGQKPFEETIADLLSSIRIDRTHVFVDYRSETLMSVLSRFDNQFWGRSGGAVNITTPNAGRVYREIKASPQLEPGWGFADPLAALCYWARGGLGGYIRYTGVDGSRCVMAADSSRRWLEVGVEEEIPAPRGSMILVAES